MIPGVLQPMVGLFASAIEVELASGGALDISTLFSSADWASSVTKRVVVPNGVTRGSSNPATPALRTGTGRGGLLEIVVDGICEGAGGALNSGVGGNALLVDQDGTILAGAGDLIGGGGGGGKGGAGGSGSVTSTVREPSSGGNYDASLYYWYDYASNDNVRVVWGGTTLYDGFTAGGNSPITVGIYTYSAYAGVATDSFGLRYSIYRTHASTTATSGGTGGAGGRGAGYDGAKASGTAGAAGGTNAGKGGTGGSGGDVGSSGVTGSTGASGNVGSGAAGAAGGLAGFAISGAANLTNHFTGTVTGRTG